MLKWLNKSVLYFFHSLDVETIVKGVDFPYCCCYVNVTINRSFPCLSLCLIWKMIPYWNFTWCYCSKAWITCTSCGLCGSFNLFTWATVGQLSCTKHWNWKMQIKQTRKYLLCCRQTQKIILHVRGLVMNTCTYTHISFCVVTVWWNASLWSWRRLYTSSSRQNR